LWWLADIGALAGSRRTRWLLWGAAPLGIVLLGQARQFALAQQFAAAPGVSPGAVAWNLLTCLALLAIMASLAAHLLWRRPATALAQ
jgi:hypothetical protein